MKTKFKTPTKLQLFVTEWLMNRYDEKLENINDPNIFTLVDVATDIVAFLDENDLVEVG